MIFDLYRTHPLILASASPRRKELLRMIGLPFESRPAPGEEIFNADPPALQAERLSKEKVVSLLESDQGLAERDVLGADTLIDLDGVPLGKPSSRDQAGDFLFRISGRTHRVITGLTLYRGKSGSMTTVSEETSVSFISLTENEITWYLNCGEWQGAAGAYRIQGKAALFVTSLQGCYYNVMGLPLYRFYGMIGSRFSPGPQY